MPEVTNGFIPVNYKGKEASRLWYTPAFLSGDITNDFEVLTNVPAGMQDLAFISKLEKILRQRTGCNVKSQKGINLWTRAVNNRLVDFNIEFCIDELLYTVNMELTRQGSDMFDITGTVLDTIMRRRIQEALVEDIYRLAYFGNTAIANLDYNFVDGLIPVHIPALVAANAIPYNNNGNIAPAAGDGFGWLEAVINQAPLTLRALPKSETQIKMFPAAYNQFLTDIHEGGGGDYGLIERLTRNGFDGYTFNGIEVHCIWKADQWVADTSSPIRNFVLYERKKNNLLVTNTASPQTSMKMIFNPYEDINIYKGTFLLGASYIFPEFMSVGYGLV